MTAILLVEDHAIVRAGLQRLLASRPLFAVRDAATADGALAILHEDAPDLVILDLNLPGLSGLEALRRFRRAVPDTPILVFSMHSEPIYAVRATEAGARGYVSKSAPPEEILDAVDAVLRGETYVERDISRELADKTMASDDYLRRLTSRDLEILRLLAEGRTLDEIARSLGVAYKTIANTCTRIREKLGARTLIELVSVAKRLGLA